MKDKHYKVRHIRMSDELWQLLKKKREMSGLSWNRFIKKIAKIK